MTDSTELLRLAVANKNDERIVKDDQEFVRDLIESGAELDSKDKSGRTPLFEAVIGNYIPSITTLLYYGADVDAKDQDDMTPLMLAVELGHRESMVALVEGNANLDLRCKSGRKAMDFCHPDELPQFRRELQQAERFSTKILPPSMFVPFKLHLVFLKIP